MNKEEFFNKFDKTKIDKNELKEIEINEDWQKDLELVKEKTAKNCNMTEFKLLLHIAKQYNLNPLKREIWAVKYKNHPAQIFVGRDGLLTIAHRSGQFGAMKTDVKFDDNQKPISATCKIWRKDFNIPFESTVYFDEYDQGHSLWVTKPVTMITKVAESTALRRAFNINGVYSPEEFPDEYNNSFDSNDDSTNIPNVNKHNKNNNTNKEGYLNDKKRTNQIKKGN